MFVGHGLLALALVSAVAARRGWTPRRALTLGVVAAGFATLPDVDVLYPLLATLAGAGSSGALTQDFWHLSTTVHRGATHSLVVGLVIAGAVTLWSRRGGDARATRALAVGAFAALVLVVGSAGGGLAGATMAVMAVGAVATAVLATRAGLGARAVGAAALAGLLTHPFGDLVTGQPPPLLYPLGTYLPGEGAIIGSRLTLHGDPTLHLVGAFLVELAAIWLAVVVVALLVDRRPTRYVRPQALAGVGFAVAVFAIPAPSLSAATSFVAGALAVGIVGAVRLPVERRFSATQCWEAVFSGLAAVTLGVVSYGVAYALL